METTLQKRYTQFGLIVLILVCFRTTIEILFLKLAADLVVVSILLLFPVFLMLLLNRQVYGQRVLVFIYVSYCFLTFLITPLSSEYSGYFGGFIGLTNLVFLVIFWFVLLSHRDISLNIQKFGRVILIIGSINALGAVIQSTISVDLFGLVNHGVYTNELALENENVNARAVSFIASPQSLALFLAFCFCFSFIYDWSSRTLKFLVRGSIFFAGVLTVSKVFFVFIFFYVFLSYLSIRSIIKLFFSIVTLFAGALVFRDQLGRVFEIFFFLENIESYSAFKIWADSLMYAIEFPEVIFGHGIGVFSRGSQSLLDYTLIHGSTESFFIQVLAEIGVIGLLLLFALIFQSAREYYYYNQNLMGIMGAFVLVGFFTPALYGYTIGILFYFILLLPLISNKSSLK
tara:strand:+ start:180 stop:1382 length:1203 start_codon:yes stop_codon:yes gene_type:complete